MALVIVVIAGEVACIKVVHKADARPFQVGVELFFAVVSAFTVPTVAGSDFN
jgi:hypothetical protein